MSAQDKARRGVEKMMEEAHDRQSSPEPPYPPPTVDHEVYLQGAIESGVTDDGLPWSRSAGTYLICWTDGSVTWRQ